MNDILIGFVAGSVTMAIIITLVMEIWSRIDEWRDRR